MSFKKYPLLHESLQVVPSKNGEFDGDLHEVQEVLVPEHVAHGEVQADGSIGVFIIAEFDPPVGSEAI